MLIGFVSLKQKGEGDKLKKWMELVVRHPMMSELKGTLSKNNSQSQGAPDYIVWVNIKQGDSWISSRIGAFWIKTSKDGATKYMAGHIEHPLAPDGKIQLTLFTPKLEEGETPKPYLYEVVYNPPMKQRESDDTYAAPTQRGNYTVSGADGEETTIIMDDEELPI